jgi:hypothetical protein
MERLAVRTTTEVYYEAADPGYKSSFTRDSLIAMSLRGDPDVLESQIDYSARRLGKVQNPFNGEEPGKAHHELPCVETNGLSTAYNACDTTATLLRSIGVLAERGYTDVLGKYNATIQEGVGYIFRHVNSNGIFVEDPKFAGASEKDGRQRRFALKVTDWKDSELNRTGRREPNYPIAYTLAHFQNAEALQRIGKAVGDMRIAKFGSYMIEAGLHYLWNEDHFVTAVDGDGIIDSPSSDSLHSLLYLSPKELPGDYAEMVQKYMKQLETPAGYRSGIPVVADVDPYHMQVWTHEQALLHAAARKHQLDEAQAVTRNITNYISPEDGLFPEFINPETLAPGGNEKQLWAMGTHIYFQNPRGALL